MSKQNNMETCPRKVSSGNLMENENLGTDSRFKDYWKGDEKELDLIKNKVSFWMEKQCIYNQDIEKNKIR